MKTFLPLLSAFNTRRLIQTALRFWQENTCLTFEENGRNTPRVKFFRGGGCYSQVGRDYGANEQLISIGHGCEQASLSIHTHKYAIVIFNLYSLELFVMSSVTRLVI